MIIWLCSYAAPLIFPNAKIPLNGELINSQGFPLSTLFFEKMQLHRTFKAPEVPQLENYYHELLE